jgi:hypothetical protein
MAFKGNLREFSPLQLLNLASLARKTGLFTIQTPADTAHLYFKAGRLIHASLASQDGRLATMLLNAGRLSPDQVRIITARPEVRSDKRLALLLMNANCLTKDEIVNSVKGYMLDVVDKLLEWHEGQFEFTPEVLPPDDRIAIPINLESVIIESSRRLQENERLQDVLPDLNSISLCFNRDFDARLCSVDLSVDEWRVTSSIRPGNTIKQIALSNHMDDFRVRKIVYGLVQAGLVELVRPEGTPLPVTTTVARQPGDEESPAARRGAVQRLFGRGQRT